MADQVADTLMAWSAAGLLEPVVIARPGSEKDQVATSVLTAGVVQEIAFQDLLYQMTEPPLLVRASLLSGEHSEVSSAEGPSTVIYDTFVKVLADLSQLKRLWVLFSDRPDATFPELVLDNWPYRAVFAAEDRGGPEYQVAALNPSKFAGHVAAGLASLCSIWVVENDAESTPATWLMSDNDGHAFDMVWMIRQYTRILEFPTLQSSLLEGMVLDPSLYPNPSQEKFERVLLGSKIDELASTFLKQFPELSLGRPDFLPEEKEVVTVGIVEKFRRVWAYLLSELAMRPVDMLDDAFGRVYTRAATLLEEKFPESNVRVQSWKEIGAPAKQVSDIANEIAQVQSQRLIQGEMSHVWLPYIHLAFSLLDGNEGEGTEIVKDLLYQTVQELRSITGDPHEVVRDPWATSAVEADTDENLDLVSPSRVAPQAMASASSQTETVTISLDASHEGVEEFQHDDESVSESSPLAVSQSATELGEGDSPVLPPPPTNFSMLPPPPTNYVAPPATQASPVVTTEEPAPVFVEQKQEVRADTSFTGSVRWLIQRDREQAVEAIRKVEEQRAQTEAAPQPQPSAQSVKPQRRGRRNLLSTAAFLLLVIAGTSYYCFVAKNQILIGFLIIVAVVVTSPFWLVLSVLRGWRFTLKKQKDQSHEARQKANEIIAEVHLKVATNRLDWRLQEIDDWNEIIGMVVHHPFAIPTASVSAEMPEVQQLGFPAAVQVAEAVIPDEQLRSLKRRFTTNVYQPGWLRARYLQLKSEAAGELLELQAEEGQATARPLEGDVSHDPESPRRRFKSIIETRLRGDDGAQLIKQMDEFLEGRPLTELVTEVNSSLPGATTIVDLEEFLDLFDTKRHPKGSVLDSHWEVAKVQGRSSIAQSMQTGNFGHVKVQTQTMGGRHLPRVIVNRFDRTNRNVVAGLIMLSPTQTDGESDPVIPEDPSTPYIPNPDEPGA